MDVLCGKKNNYDITELERIRVRAYNKTSSHTDE